MKKMFIILFCLNVIYSVAFGMMNPSSTQSSKYTITDISNPINSANADDTDTVIIKPGGLDSIYYTVHHIAFTNLDGSVKCYTAYCYENPNGIYPYHRHSCSSCNSVEPIR